MSGREPAAQTHVLVLAPTGRDGANSQAVLDRAGLPCVVCRDVGDLCAAIAAGAGAVILTEEAVGVDQDGCLAEALGNQPAWSDLPVLLLTRGGPESRVARRAMQTLGNVVLLARPVRVTTLVTAVRAALRARARQYEIRENLAQLQEADRRKDEFLAMLAHELRNPLAPIRTALHVMQAPVAPPEMVTRAWEMTERQVAHLARLLDDLLEVSRVSRGKIALKDEMVDLGTVLTRVAETTLSAVTARGHGFRLVLPGTPQVLRADPARLEQVFVNLVTNAVKYTPTGGQIEVAVEGDGEAVVVRVRDTGIGIAPALLPRVFDLFVQAEPGSDRSQGGLGIGLTLVKSLVEMHGGTVRAASEGPGRGSEFVVRLPRRDPGMVAGVRPAAGPDPRRVQAKRVLVVDDNADAAESLALLLQLGGHDVRTAADGPRAIAVAAAFRPEVVFLDIGLPGMSGHEVARRLREGPPVTLVAVTGYGQEDDRRRSAAAGFDHHLVKPAAPDVIYALLANAG